MASLWVDREPYTVSQIEVRIGDQWARHNFGRQVTAEHARQWAQHYISAFTKDSKP